MLNSRNVGPVSFEVYSNNKRELVPPVMMIDFPEVNTYEVRAHIYQGMCVFDGLVRPCRQGRTRQPSCALHGEIVQILFLGNCNQFIQTLEFNPSPLSGRELLSPEVDGTINAYCVVSCWRHTAITRTIKKQLSPTWDQSFMFKGISINGNSNDVRNSLPAVNITIWHNGANADVPVGVVSVSPSPFFGEVYRPSRMMWYPVYSRGEHQGDILGAFEIFQVSTY
eukprot:sb/3469701/